ncbi:hypothetical protein AB0E27_10760 [Streptomyces sparsogenes]|uniref:hypothetical protein n=1 Tax=Streptomyces sparsogenes TaxID=67365 RepID=UPI0033D72054
MNIIEITNAYETAEQATVDWSLTYDPEVLRIAQRAARKVGEQYGSTLEAEDAYQEALMVIATRPSAARSSYEKGSGALYRWIGQRLRDAHLTDAKRRSRMKSWEVNQAQLEAQGY